jgi:3-deoxy-D-manno-octulosonate 8-phosphate phosphatase (KDO 8-P phosphatase)
MITTDTNILAKNIKLIVFDVDGVLTDGGLYFSDKGTEFKRFNALDGLGMKLLRENGIEVAIISARKVENVVFRMRNLNIEHYYQGQSDKRIALNTLLQKLNLTLTQVAYVGDDVIDLPVMRQVSLPIAVHNAHDLVKDHAKFITQKEGGKGAVREVCDILLKAQGKFEKAMQVYLT